MIEFALGLLLYLACGMAVSFVMLHIIDATSRRCKNGDNGSAVEREGVL